MKTTPEKTNKKITPWIVLGTECPHVFGTNFPILSGQLDIKCFDGVVIQDVIPIDGEFWYGLNEKIPQSKVGNIRFTLFN